MIKVLDLTQGNIIAFRMEGKIEAKDYEIIDPLLEKTKKENEEIKLFMDIGKIEGLEGAAITEDFKTYFKHIGSVSRIAVVTDYDSQKVLLKLSDIFTNTEIKFFPQKEKDIAIAWVTRES